MLIYNHLFRFFTFDKDEGAGGTAGQGAGTTPANGGASETGDEPFDKARAMATITKLREIEKERDKLRKEAADRKKLDDEREAEFQKEMGDYKSLYETQRAESAKLKADAENGSVYQKAFQTSLDARIAAIPEENRSLVPDGLDPIKLGEWLDKNAAKLGQSTVAQASGAPAAPPPGDPGRSGKQPSPGNPGKTGRLTFDDLRKMSASEIASRWNDPAFQKDLADAQKQSG